MQKRSLLLFLLLSCLSQLSAQNGSPPAAGAKGIAMGNTGTSHTGIYSLFSNQAGLSNVKQAEVAVFGEQRFFISDLTILNAGVAIPTKTGVFGLQIQQFGFSQYTEQRAGLAYAKKLMKNLSVGAQIDFLHTRIPEYGNQSALTFELGIQAEILPKLTWSAHVFSPLSVKISEDYELPSIFNVGLAYRSSEKLWLTVEMEKDIAHPVSVKAGLEYFATSNFSLRLGGGTQPTLFTFGLGYTKNRIQLDVASAYHQTLGLMPAFSAAYQLSKK